MTSSQVDTYPVLESRGAAPDIAPCAEVVLADIRNLGAPFQVADCEPSAVAPERDETRHPPYLHLNLQVWGAFPRSELLDAQLLQDALRDEAPGLRIKDFQDNIDAGCFMERRVRRLILLPKDSHELEYAQ